MSRQNRSLRARSESRVYLVERNNKSGRKTWTDGTATVPPVELKKMLVKTLFPSEK